MNRDVEKIVTYRLNSLLDRESVLEQSIDEESDAYKGLLHIDSYTTLIVTKLHICLSYLDLIEQEPDKEKGRKLNDEARKRARTARQMLEFIHTVTISEDQRGMLTESKEYDEAKELFHQLLLRGGAAFFEHRIENKKHARMIAKQVMAAIDKFVPSDDTYAQLFKTEDLSPFWRRIVNTFFFVLAPEHQKEPPYGIDEGEEEEYTADNIKLPLSQAIFYYEHEILPMLREMLAASPGDDTLQTSIDEVTNRIEMYRNISLKPRSLPIVLPKDYYTEGFLQYDAEGEPLVEVSLPVTFSSKTNLDRMQELVKFEIARRLAGKGVCPELDKEYSYLRSLESGTKGSSFFPGFKLRTERAFGFLKHQYPPLRTIDNRREFKQLVEKVVYCGRKQAEIAFEKRLLRSGTERNELPE